MTKMRHETDKERETCREKKRERECDTEQREGVRRARGGRGQEGKKKSEHREIKMLCTGGTRERKKETDRDEATREAKHVRRDFAYTCTRVRHSREIWPAISRTLLSPYRTAPVLTPPAHRHRTSPLLTSLLAESACVARARPIYIYGLLSHAHCTYTPGAWLRARNLPLIIYKAV